MDIARDMDAYDRLPSAVRAVLRDTTFDYAAGLVRAYVAGHGRERAVRRLREIDRRVTAAERVSTWGPDYPEHPAG